MSRHRLCAKRGFQSTFRIKPNKFTREPLVNRSYCPNSKMLFLLRNDGLYIIPKRVKFTIRHGTTRPRG